MTTTRKNVELGGSHTYSGELGGLLSSAGSYFRKRYKSARDLNDAEFLSLFDIPEVNKRINDGFNIKATAALLSHFQTRVEKDWLTPPTQLADLAFDVSSTTDEELIARADLVLDYDLEFSGVPPEINRFGEIDWQHNILQNREWLYRLNRHSWWPLLGLAYQRSGDERYAKAFAFQLSAWINENFPVDITQADPHVWASEQVALRLRVSWIPAFGMFYHSPHFNTTRKLEMLRSIFDQARFLKQQKAQDDLLLNGGLVSAGLSFPELREARKWRKAAVQRCRDYFRGDEQQRSTNLLECSDRALAEQVVAV